jgi:hypothetical protein
METFDRQKINEVESKEQYQVKISGKLEALVT